MDAEPVITGTVTAAWMFEMPPATPVAVPLVRFTDAGAPNDE